MPMFKAEYGCQLPHPEQRKIRQVLRNVDCADTKNIEVRDETTVITITGEMCPICRAMFLSHVTSVGEDYGVILTILPDGDDEEPEEE